jgi:hypothetical protein
MDTVDNPASEDELIIIGKVFYNNLIGMYSRTQKTWYLKQANNDGWSNVDTHRFGSTDSTWIPVVGDWNGDGKDTIGMYSRTQKTWYLKGSNSDGWGDVTTVRFGSTDSSWTPVAGDWNGDGTDTIGMYSRTQKTWYLKGSNTDGWGDVTTVRFGSTDSSWIPVVGDWNDCGPDKIGMYSRTQKTWYLKGSNTDGWGDVTTVRFGSTDSSWIPVVGDWNGDSGDQIGMYSRNQKTWYLKDANNDGWGNVNTVRFGSTDSSWIPVVGDWDGIVTVSTDFVWDQISIPAGSTGSATVTCPSGSIVVSGGYAGNETVDAYTHRKNGNGWIAYGKNNSGTSQLMNVYATCLNNVPGWTTQVLDQVTAGVGTYGHPVADCPSGSTVTGGGWATNSSGTLWVYNSSKTLGNSWEIYARNLSGTGKLVNAYAICLHGVDATIDEIYEGVTIPPGPGTYDNASPECPFLEYVTGGGFAASDDLIMYNTSPDTSNNQWDTWAENMGTSSRLINGYAECLSFP